MVWYDKLVCLVEPLGTVRHAHKKISHDINDRHGEADNNQCVVVLRVYYTRRYIDYISFIFLFLQFNFAAFNGRIGIYNRNVSHVVTVDILWRCTTLIITQFTINIV